MKVKLVKFIMISLLLSLECSSVQGVNQIRKDLVGRKIEDSQMGWRLDSVSDILEVKVNDQQMMGDYLDFDVNLIVIDSQTGSKYKLNVFMSYKVDRSGKCELKSVREKSWEFLGWGRK